MTTQTDNTNPGFEIDNAYYHAKTESNNCFILYLLKKKLKPSDTSTCKQRYFSAYNLLLPLRAGYLNKV